MKREKAEGEVERKRHWEEEEGKVGVRDGGMRSNFTQ